MCYLVERLAMECGDYEVVEPHVILSCRVAEASGRHCPEPIKRHFPEYDIEGLCKYCRLNPDTPPDSDRRGYGGKGHGSKPHGGHHHGGHRRGIR